MYYFLKNLFNKFQLCLKGKNINTGYGWKLVFWEETRHQHEFLKKNCQSDLIFSGNRADSIPGFQQDAWEGGWKNIAA